MRPRPDKAKPPTHDDLVRVLGELIALCYKWRMYGVALTRAEHIHNRALVTKPKRRDINRSSGQGRLV